MEVTVSNRVSRGSLSSVIFVLERPCRPPPVKNMGPLKLQVRQFTGLIVRVLLKEMFLHSGAKTQHHPSGRVLRGGHRM